MALPVLFILLAISAYLFTYWHTTYRVVKAHHFLHEEAYWLDMCLRKEIKNLRDTSGDNFRVKHTTLHSLDAGLALIDQEGKLVKSLYLRKKQNRPCLYLKYGEHPATEIADNIQCFTISYGIKATQTSPLFYTDNPSAYALNQIRVIQLNFLLQSKNEVLFNRMSYSFNGKNIIPQDRKIYLPLKIVTSMA
ncbi:MAG: hypothetical protein HY939_05060 [Gammaproteobacteria bacterium]|nr:hypothetical protein [Gammaproteobacteria bacterium]